MKEEHYQNHIQGMLCRQCEEAVCLALNSQRGVLYSKCSFVRNTVEVTYDAGVTNCEQIESTLLKAGYPAGRKKPKQYMAEAFFLITVIGLYWCFKSMEHIALPTIETGASLWIIFFAGLLTGTHCISMCGGIALSQTQPQLGNQNRGSLKGVLSYHVGRLVTATMLGAVFGGIGSVFGYSMKAKSMVFSLLGLAMIMVALRMWGIFPWLRELDSLIPSFCKFPQMVKRKIYGRSLLVGLFTGIMPCGVSYAMWLYAASSGSSIKGAAVMGIWCLGTMPLLLGLCLLGRFIPTKYSKWMNIANVLLILMFGVSMMASGLRALT